VSYKCGDVGQTILGDSRDDLGALVMQLTIMPLKGVGDVKFGMSAEEVRSVIGANFRSFKRSAQAAFPCDHFPELSAFFYYDFEGRLEAVEFAAPAEPVVAGVKLLGFGFEDTCTTLRGLDEQTKKEVDSAVAYQLGISIYAPSAKNNPAAVVESVLAFRPGYYN